MYIIKNRRIIVIGLVTLTVTKYGLEVNLLVSNMLYIHICLSCEKYLLQRNLNVHLFRVLPQLRNNLFNMKKLIVNSFITNYLRLLVFIRNSFITNHLGLLVKLNLPQEKWSKEFFSNK